MKTISLTRFSSLLTSCHAIAQARNRPTCDSYELQDTVLIGPKQWAEDIHDEAAPLWAAIAQIEAGEKAAADAAEEERLANPPPPEPWRVSKDTIIQRVKDAGQLPWVMAVLASQSAEEQFLFEHSAWFWSTNQTLRQLCAAATPPLDADAILARDPFLF